MIHLILCLLMSIVVYSCKNENCPPDTSNTELILLKDSIQQEQKQRTALQQHLEAYKLDINYTDTIQWKLTTAHYTALMNWKRRLEEDSYWKQINREELEKHLVIQITSSVNASIDKSIALKRLDDIEEMLVSMIGTRHKVNIPVFKVLKSTVFKKENKVNLELNYLLY